MAFARIMCKASRIDKIKRDLILEKQNAIKLEHGETPDTSFRQKYRHWCIDLILKIKRRFKKMFSFPEHTCMHRTCFNLRHEGTCENFTLKSILGFVGGFLLTYVFFMFFVFQLNFKLSTATIMCSFFGCILTIGLAFSYKVRCIVFLLLPQFFSKRGRQALLAYAFILAITGPAKNTLNNMGILSESMACGQEQLKAAVKQIIEAIKKPFYAIKDAIKQVVKTIKQIVKKIKEILLTIKRIIMAIVKVIKAAFQFLMKIFSICNKELGTPFERCSRVFENAIDDCNAKLGPLFNWLCSIAYLVKAVCYIVKIFDFVCMLVDIINDSVIVKIIRKIKTFVRHIRTMFYVRIKFSHSFHFQTNQSKSLGDVAEGIVTEIRHRTEGLLTVFDLISCATSLFFIFIIFKVVHYRFKFLTSERFDNKFITKDFRQIDMRRAQLEKETVLPLNHRERNLYIPSGSWRLVKTEKVKLSHSAVALSTATLKLCTHMVADYGLFWVLTLIRYHGRFQSTINAPNIPGLNIQGKGLLADLLRSIVNAFQPIGIKLEIDTIPCLPDPIPPDYDRYIQIASLLVLCWILTMFEPYGLRMRNRIMCYYYPTRAKQRSIWLYNHIMRSRSSFLKFARRQLRRKVTGNKGITKVTCKEYLRANLGSKWMRLCLGPDKQQACLLCGEVFRENDSIKPIRCKTPGCPGIYCEQCFQDLQNLCTVCLDPIEYGDLSDISEEKDSSEDEIPSQKQKKKKKKKKCSISKCFQKPNTDDHSDDEDDDNPKPTKALLPPGDDTEPTTTDTEATTGGNTTDYSYSYQDDKDITQPTKESSRLSFVDVEKQHIPDYASMESFSKEEEPVKFSPPSAKTDASVKTSSQSYPSDSGSDSESYVKPVRGKSVYDYSASYPDFPLFKELGTSTSFTTSDDERTTTEYTKTGESSTAGTTSDFQFPSSDDTEIPTFIRIPPDTSSSIDSEIKGRFLMMPKLDFSSLHSSSSSWSHGVFDSVRYGEVSERSATVPTKSKPSKGLLSRAKKKKRGVTWHRDFSRDDAVQQTAAAESYKKKARNYYKSVCQLPVEDRPKACKRRNKIMRFFSNMFRKGSKECKVKDSAQPPFPEAPDEIISFESPSSVKASEASGVYSRDTSPTSKDELPGSLRHSDTSQSSFMGSSPRKHLRGGVDNLQTEDNFRSSNSAIRKPSDNQRGFSSSDSEISELVDSKDTNRINKSQQTFSKEPTPKPSNVINIVAQEDTAPLIPNQTTPDQTDLYLRTSDFEYLGLENQMNSRQTAAYSSTFKHQRYSREPPEKDENPGIPMRSYPQNKDDDHHRKRDEIGNHRPPQYPERYKYQPGSTTSSTISMESAQKILGRSKKIPDKYSSPAGIIDDSCKRNTHKVMEYFTGDRKKPIQRKRSPEKGIKPPCRSKSTDDFYHSCPMCSGDRTYCLRSPCSSRRRSPTRPAERVVERGNDFQYGEPAAEPISRREHYRCQSPSYRNRPPHEPFVPCQCCQCTRCTVETSNGDDRMSTHSNTSENSNSMHLAYQNFEDYPDLVHELEDTLSHRNKDRVRRTMREFEIMSSQNKNLEKPIIYDDEVDDGGNNQHVKLHRKPKRKQRSAERVHIPRYDDKAFHERRMVKHYSPQNQEAPRGDAVERHSIASVQEQVRKYSKYNKSRVHWKLDPVTGEWCKDNRDPSPKPCKPYRCPCEAEPDYYDCRTKNCDLRRGNDHNHPSRRCERCKCGRERYMC